MFKLRAWVLATVLLTLATVLYISWKVTFSKVAQMLSGLDSRYLLLYIAISLLIAGLLTFKWRLVLSSQDISIPFHRLFAYRLVGYSVSYLTPTIHAGSEPIRGYLLHREGIPGPVAASNVIIDKSVELLADVAFFTLGAILLLHSVLVSTAMKTVFLIVAGIFIVLMTLFVQGLLSPTSMFVKVFRFLRLHRVKSLDGVEKSLAQVEEEVQRFYRHRKGTFLSLMLLMVVIWVCMYFEYRFLLLMLGQEATLAQVFLILTGVGIAYSIPVPAAIGALELGQLSAAKVLALSSITAVSLAVIVRLRDLVWTILGLGYLVFYHFSFRSLAAKSQEINKRFEQGNLKRGS